MQTLLRLSVYWWNEPFSWTAFGLVSIYSQLSLESVHVGTFIVLHKLAEVIFPCWRLPANPYILRSDFVKFWFEPLSFVFLRREISDSFSSLKLLFTSSGWTSMLKQGSNSKIENISPSSSPVLQYKITYLIHFPRKQHNFASSLFQQPV